LLLVEEFNVAQWRVHELLVISFVLLVYMSFWAAIRQVS
jgi:hypothetical protein